MSTETVPWQKEKKKTNNTRDTKHLRTFIYSMMEQLNGIAGKLLSLWLNTTTASTVAAAAAADAADAAATLIYMQVSAHTHSHANRQVRTRHFTLATVETVSYWCRCFVQ